MPDSASVLRRIVILGSTGSIGRNTLDVVRARPDRLAVVALVAHSSWPTLLEQAREFRPRYVVLTDKAAFEAANPSALPPDCELRYGEDGIAYAVALAEVDVVVSAIVGAAGLRGTWAAIEAGKTIALANKETLVVAGALVMESVRKHGVTLIPVDSEHSAVFQALVGEDPRSVDKIILTASGGPFRGKSIDELRDVTPEQALRHPTWRMGPKISIDSATLMNKSLEVIEACRLFDMPPERVEVIIHPESMIHSFVEFVDGSVLAQMSPPDMRLPIQYALFYPERTTGPTKRVDWRRLGPLRFENVDPVTFPAVTLGHEVAHRGGTSGAVLNAANEAAVSRFLNRDLAFLDIPRVCRAVLDAHEFDPSPTLSVILAADSWARREVMRWRHPQTNRQA